MGVPVRMTRRLQLMRVKLVYVWLTVPRDERGKMCQRGRERGASQTRADALEFLRRCPSSARSRPISVSPISSVSVRSFSYDTMTTAVPIMQAAQSGREASRRQNE